MKFIKFYIYYIEHNLYFLTTVLLRVIPTILSYVKGILEDNQ